MVDGIRKYQSAVDIIKTAILQSQARAAKAVNQEQLALYYGIGRYVSANSRKKNWGTGAIETIIFASSDTPNVGDYDGDMSETKLTERQQKILNLIRESPTITGKQMSETLSVSQRTIERDLSALQKIGILKHEGKDNDGKWVVISVSH